MMNFSILNQLAGHFHSEGKSMNSLVRSLTAMKIQTPFTENFSENTLRAKNSILDWFAEFWNCFLKLAITNPNSIYRCLNIGLIMRCPTLPPLPHREKSDDPGSKRLFSSLYHAVRFCMPQDQLHHLKSNLRPIYWKDYTISFVPTICTFVIYFLFIDCSGEIN